MTPRTVSESYAHNLDMPGVATAKRRYTRGTQSANWKAEDRRKWRIVTVVSLAAILFFWVA